MANEQDRWREDKMTKVEQYYLALSEVYLAELDNHAESFIKIMQAKGIVLELESDLIFFLKKNKPTEKSIKQQDRIDLLKSIFDHFAKVSSSNDQYRLLLRKSAAKQRLLEEEIIALKADNELMMNLIKEDGSN